ncbi:hypothetical protein BKA62DRAFT_702581 [Auriculariales sp. MPI-PUGE-AT-0066]|nr:hypothetical protein BKA62DRAFT_702581 [Auriculariales sp. MPI-PUGE-AT-0066]
MASTMTTSTSTATKAISNSLPSFSSTFADIDPHAPSVSAAGAVAASTSGAPSSAIGNSSRSKKRRHADEDVEIKQELDERDELDPSPPPPHRQHLLLHEQAATTLESLRAHTNTATDSPSASLSLSTTAPVIASPASSTGDGHTILPQLTSFANRRRQSQNSAGAEKASRLTIRPPPSPYGQSAAAVAGSDRLAPGLRGVPNSLLPAIHSAPAAGWAQRQEAARAATSGQSSAASSQFDHPAQAGPASSMRLPVVPPVPNLPPTPRTAMPFGRRAPPPAALPPLSGLGRGGHAPRTAGLPTSTARMGPPALPTAGLSNFRTSIHNSALGGNLRDDYVQPIRTARPALGGSSQGGLGFSGHGASSNLNALGFGGIGSQADRDRTAFLAPFAAFYDALLDARRLKGWLADQLRAQAPLEGRLKTVERECDTLRRRVAELESAGGSHNAAGDQDITMAEASSSGAPPPAAGRVSPQTHLSAPRLERPHSQPHGPRSAAPEPSPNHASHALPTPVPPKTPNLAAPPRTSRAPTPTGPAKSSNTLSPPLGMLGARITSPRAPTHAHAHAHAHGATSPGAGAAGTSAGSSSSARQAAASSSHR